MYSIISVGLKFNNLCPNRILFTESYCKHFHSSYKQLINNLYLRLKNNYFSSFQFIKIFEEIINRHVCTLKKF